MRTYLNAKQVRTKLGGISRMTLWRLENHPDYRHRKFPKSEELTPGIFLWDDEAIDNWIAGPKKDQNQNLLDLAISVLQAPSGNFSVQAKG